MTVETVQKLRRTCAVCHRVFTVGDQISWRVDPYDSEINEDYTKKWMCQDCYDLRSDEI